MKGLEKKKLSGTEWWASGLILVRWVPRTTVGSGWGTHCGLVGVGPGRWAKSMDPPTRVFDQVPLLDITK